MNAELGLDRTDDLVHISVERSVLERLDHAARAKPSKIPAS